MTKLDIEYLPSKALQPYPRNARTHSKKQIKQIADSISSLALPIPFSSTKTI